MIESALIESGKRQLEWEGRTTKFGFQGPNDVFESPNEGISHLESILRRAVDDYFNKFIKEANTFISNWPRDYKLSGWYNRLVKNGHHTAHIHSKGWLSGVIYPTKIYSPNPGDVVLFPSSLFHRTIPFTSDSERITIAFDLVKI